MFIGHFAVGFAAKEAAPEVSLGTLVLSAQFLDLLWPILLIFGVEHVRIDPGNTAFTPLDFLDYPISHSLVTALVWGVAFGIVYFAVRRKTRGAWILGAGVVSHWLLDAISHGPDLPLTPGVTAYVGLGLWDSVPASIIVEACLFVLGVFGYLRATPTASRKSRIAFWAFAGLLLLFWILSILGPPPPDVRAVAWGSLALWLFVPLGYWIDRKRNLRSRSG